jgi:hypothetical protein
MLHNYLSQIESDPLVIRSIKTKNFNNARERIRLANLKRANPGVKQWTLYSVEEDEHKVPNSRAKRLYRRKVQRDTIEKELLNISNAANYPSLSIGTNSKYRIKQKVEEEHKTRPADSSAKSVVSFGKSLDLYKPVIHNAPQSSVRYVKMVREADLVRLNEWSNILAVLPPLGGILPGIKEINYEYGLGKFIYTIDENSQPIDPKTWLVNYVITIPMSVCRDVKGRYGTKVAPSSDPVIRKIQLEVQYINDTLHKYPRWYRYIQFISWFPEGSYCLYDYPKKNRKIMRRHNETNYQSIIDLIQSQEELSYFADMFKILSDDKDPAVRRWFLKVIEGSSKYLTPEVSTIYDSLIHKSFDMDFKAKNAILSSYINGSSLLEHEYEDVMDKSMTSGEKDDLDYETAMRFVTRSYPLKISFNIFANSEVQMKIKGVYKKLVVDQKIGNITFLTYRAFTTYWTRRKDYRGNSDFMDYLKGILKPGSYAVNYTGKVVRTIKLTIKHVRKTMKGITKTDDKSRNQKSREKYHELSRQFNLLNDYEDSDDDDNFDKEPVVAWTSIGSKPKYQKVSKNVIEQKESDVKIESEGLTRRPENFKNKNKKSNRGKQNINRAKSQRPRVVGGNKYLITDDSLISVFLFLDAYEKPIMTYKETRALTNVEILQEFIFEDRLYRKDVLQYMVKRGVIPEIDFSKITSRSISLYYLINSNVEYFALMNNHYNECSQESYSEYCRKRTNPQQTVERKENTSSPPIRQQEVKNDDDTDSEDDEKKDLPIQQPVIQPSAPTDPNDDLIKQILEADEKLELENENDQNSDADSENTLESYANRYNTVKKMNNVKNKILAGKEEVFHKIYRLNRDSRDITVSKDEEGEIKGHYQPLLVKTAPIEQFLTNDEVDYDFLKSIEHDICIEPKLGYFNMCFHDVKMAIQELFKIVIPNLCFIKTTLKQRYSPMVLEEIMLDNVNQNLVTIKQNKALILKIDSIFLTSLRSIPYMQVKLNYENIWSYFTEQGYTNPRLDKLLNIDGIKYSHTRTKFMGVYAVLTTIKLDGKPLCDVYLRDENNLVDHDEPDSDTDTNIAELESKDSKSEESVSPEILAAIRRRHVALRNKAMIFSPCFEFSNINDLLYIFNNIYLTKMSTFKTGLKNELTKSLLKRNHHPNCPEIVRAKIVDFCITSLEERLYNNVSTKVAGPIEIETITFWDCILEKLEDSNDKVYKSNGIEMHTMIHHFLDENIEFVNRHGKWITDAAKSSYANTLMNLVLLYKNVVQLENQNNMNLPSIDERCGDLAIIIMGWMQRVPLYMNNFQLYRGMLLTPELIRSMQIKHRVIHKRANTYTTASDIIYYSTFVKLDHPTGSLAIFKTGRNAYHCFIRNCAKFFVAKFDPVSILLNVDSVENHYKPLAKFIQSYDQDLDESLTLYVKNACKYGYSPLHLVVSDSFNPPTFYGSFEQNNDPENTICFNGEFYNTKVIFASPDMIQTDKIPPKKMFDKIVEFCNSEIYFVEMEDLEIVHESTGNKEIITFFVQSDFMCIATKDLYMTSSDRSLFKIGPVAPFPYGFKVANFINPIPGYEHLCSIERIKNFKLAPGINLYTYHTAPYLRPSIYYWPVYHKQFIDNFLDISWNQNVYVSRIPNTDPKLVNLINEFLMSENRYLIIITKGPGYEKIISMCYSYITVILKNNYLGDTDVMRIIMELCIKYVNISKCWGKLDGAIKQFFDKLVRSLQNLVSLPNPTPSVTVLVNPKRYLCGKIGEKFGSKIDAYYNNDEFFLKDTIENLHKNVNIEFDKHPISIIREVTEHERYYKLTQYKATLLNPLDSQIDKDYTYDFIMPTVSALIHALVTRQGAPTLVPNLSFMKQVRNSDVIKKFSEVIRRQFANINFSELSFDHYLNGIEPAKRHMIKLGYAKFRRNGRLNPKVVIFVKNFEKIYADIEGKKKLRARLINNPTAEVKAILGHVAWSIQKCCLLVKSFIASCLPVSKRVAFSNKRYTINEYSHGENKESIENKLTIILSTFKDPVIISTDSSAHDAHQSTPALRLDSTIYDVFLMDLLARLGYTLHEALSIRTEINRYRVPFSYNHHNMKKTAFTGNINQTVYSGQPMRTSLGNTIRCLLININMAYNADFLEDYYTMQNGDDTIEIIEKHRLLDYIKAKTMTYGIGDQIYGPVKGHGCGMRIKEFRISQTYGEFCSRCIVYDKNAGVCISRFARRTYMTGLKTAVIGQTIDKDTYERGLTYAMEYDTNKINLPLYYIARQNSMGNKVKRPISQKEILKIFPDYNYTLKSSKTANSLAPWFLKLVPEWQLNTLGIPLMLIINNRDNDNDVKNQRLINDMDLTKPIAQSVPVHHSEKFGSSLNPKKNKDLDHVNLDFKHINKTKINKNSSNPLSLKKKSFNYGKKYYPKNGKKHNKLLYKMKQESDKLMPQNNINEVKCNTIFGSSRGFKMKKPSSNMNINKSIKSISGVKPKLNYRLKPKKPLKNSKNNSSKSSRSSKQRQNQQTVQFRNQLSINKTNLLDAYRQPFRRYSNVFWPRYNQPSITTTDYKRYNFTSSTMTGAGALLIIPTLCSSTSGVFVSKTTSTITQGNLFPDIDPTLSHTQFDTYNWPGRWDASYFTATADNDFTLFGRIVLISIEMVIMSPMLSTSGTFWLGCEGDHSYPYTMSYYSAQSDPNYVKGVFPGVTKIKKNYTPVSVHEELFSSAQSNLNPYTSAIVSPWSREAIVSGNSLPVIFAALQSNSLTNPLSAFIDIIIYREYSGSLVESEYTCKVPEPRLADEIYRLQSLDIIRASQQEYL